MTMQRVVSLIIIASIIAISVFGWVAIPEGTMIARHWDMAGEPDGFSPRSHVLIGMPMLALALTALFLAIPLIEPRRKHRTDNSALLNVSWLGALGLLLVVHASIVFAATAGETSPPLPQATLFAVSVLLILIGNFTAKSRSNFSLGSERLGPCLRNTPGASPIGLQAGCLS